MTQPPWPSLVRCFVKLTGVRARAAAVALLLASLLLAHGVWGGPTRDRLVAAIEAQEAIVASQPSDASAHNDLGNLLVLAGDVSAAEAAYRRAIELDESSIASRFNLALLLQSLPEMSRKEESARLLNEVIVAEPTHAWAHYQLGRVYESLHRDDAAIEQYSRAFTLDPDLAFPDVNPHIISNRHATEALLLAHRSNGLNEAVPRTYGDPGRITTLLLPALPTPPSEKGSGEDGTPAETEETHERPRSGMQEPAVTDSPKARRNLSRRDLDGGNPGEASQAPRAASSSSPPPPPRRRMAGSGSSVITSDSATDEREKAVEPAKRSLGVRDLEALGNINQATEGAGSRPSSSGVRTRPTVRNPRPTPSSPSRFRPGPRSNAQMEPVLRPLADSTEG